jgi:hypothetical protein
MDNSTPRIEMYEVNDPVENAAAQRRQEQFERNWDWLEAHSTEVYNHRGKFICIAGQELYVGDSVAAVVNPAKAAHPEEEGILTRYIPKERGARIYVAGWIMEVV